LDAAIEDEVFERYARDLAANGIEAGESNRTRRIIDNDVDTGRAFEGADVATFFADDLALISSLGASP